ncbi:MAG: alpha-2-macroglobulin [Bacteroidetes bacterium]|nr:MAG: alpha-2-macroglobulin [Bacteroidota bacterium]
MSNRLLLAIAAFVALATFSLTFFSKKGISSDSVSDSKVDPAFSAYISAYTSGIISNESTVRVRLANDYTGTITYDKPVEETYFSFDPSIEGKTYWIDSRTLEFRPDKRLPSDKAYEAEFFLSKLVPEVPKELGTMEFGFRTMKQSFDVVVDGMKTTDKKTLRRQRMVGTLTTADAADKEIIEKMLTVSQNGKNLFIRWEHEGDNITHRFSVDSIVRADKAGKIILSWDGKPLDVDIKKSQDIVIPALGDFKVMGIKVDQAPEQMVTIQFSDPIAEKQNLDGMITIAGTSGLRFSVEDNDVKVYPVSRLSGTHQFTVNQGVKNILGYPLPHAFSEQVEFEELKPEIKLLGNGVVLPNSDKGLLLPFQAVSLKAVDVKVLKIYESNIPQFLQVNNLEGERELRRVGKVVVKKKIDLTVKSAADYGRWNTYSIDMSTLVKAEPGAIYKVILGFKKSYSAYHCDSESPDDRNMAEVATEEEEEEDGSVGYYSDYYYDSYSYYDSEYDEDYDYSERENPCNSAYYRNKSVSRNVLASDLGLIAKRGNDGSMTFAVADIRSTQPIANTTLEVYDFTQQLLSTVTTDRNGLASVNLKKRPFLLIAKNGTQRGYLKLDDGSSLSLSAFDVSGEQVQKGLKGFIYGERGVWRPGDTLFLSFILEDKQKLLPATHPVSFELVNPRGQTVKKTVRSSSVNGFYDFTTPTDMNAPTGTWTARIKVGGAIFTKDIKVETIMPNRLKMNLDFGSINMFTTDNNKQAKLEVKWLHGAIARNLGAKVDVTLWQVPTQFKSFEKYDFDDPATRFSSESQSAFDGSLNEEGIATFTPNIDAKDAPGMLKASFQTRVFEQGGAFSTDRFTIPFSPYSHYVGLLTPQSSRYWGTLETGKAQDMMLASVDQNGKPVPGRKLLVKVYKLQWRWWWSSSEDYLAQYVNSTYHQPYKEQEITSAAGGRASFKLNVGNDDWGRYLIRVTDVESGHSTGSVVYFDWPEWMGSAMKNSEAATLLQFNADKQSYVVGDKINLTIPSPGQGRALISVETGSKILQAFWVESLKKGNITYSIPVTSDMAPNVYVHVTLVQPHAQTINDAPIRLYGVIPISVDDPNTHLRPLIACADVWKPEEEASVTVSEESGKEMTYTLAVVDEGLLDLTRFKTPDPWNSFYAREALGVRTWDMYDLVMGAYGAELERVLAIGGDGEGDGKGGNKANRFKPMVKFMGPFHLKKGEKHTKKFMMPQYVGAVRVMVISGMNAAYGHTDKSVFVRKPLMILGTLPRVVGPGEEVDLPVSVFAMEKKVKNVSVSIKTNGLFDVVDEKTKAISFKQVGDEVVSFKLKVKSAIGVGKVEIVATGAGETAKYSIELDVRNPNPPVTKIIEAVIDPGKSWSSAYIPVGIAGTNKGTVEISSIPPLNLGDRLNYLVQYPHGCVEQTTSSVFPQLYLTDLLNLDDKMSKRITENIKAGVNRLRSFQTSSGGLGYWPGDDSPSEWGSNYAGHFLLEAEKKGYTLPSGMLENWKRFQKQRAQAWTPRYDRYYYYNDDLMQAYRLYTLALANAAELGAMNRLREVKSLSTAAKWRLAAAYQLAGQAETAKQLITGLPTDIKEYRELSYTYGSSDRDIAMILETSVVLGDRTRAASLMQKVAKALSRNSYWMSTQETAYCLLAIGKFMGANKGDKQMNYVCTVNSKATNYTGAVPISQVDMNIANAAGGSATIQNKGSGVLYARIILTGTPETGDQSEAENDLGMDIRYTSMTGTEIDVTNMEQGTDFIAEVTVTNPGLRGRYDELALNQIFPSGWEIHNTRMDDVANPDIKSARPAYQDIRDDRVYTYFYLYAKETKTFRIQLNAAYVGKFYQPSVYCEAMYDNSISALKPGQWVTVTRGGGESQ